MTWMSGRVWRRRTLMTIPALLTIAIIVYVCSSIIAFANIFGLFKPHSGVQITQKDIADAHTIKTDLWEAVVPKIIHQIYHNWHDANEDTLRPDWAVAQKTCIDLHPGWQHILWTTKSSRQFIEEKFPSLLPVYDRYPYPVQKVDVVKYFVLRYYGGIYIDLDNGCAANLEPLTYYPAFTTDGGHGALSNNIIGGQAGHPFFSLLTDSLAHWQVNYVLPYLTIMHASGQWYFTAIWERYHSLLSRQPSTLYGTSEHELAPLHHILMDMRPGSDPWVFFTQVDGNSWANWDNRVFSFIGDHIVSTVVFLTSSAFLIGWVFMRCWTPRVYKMDSKQSSA
ncbi:hypothetical protein PENSTE_c009G05241 [Penicillium steckii]|uniref:Uncharacterized protein n=1 Tax=Penicillium steckii TaxID=303698 RepID=A0A1V6T9F8_9EURO|nr:hypothetical protein PENSTE_c009G05241 [Penicillium steckii]